MSADEKQIERLRKLLELARRGVGGEAETAERFLKKMLARHGLTMADIDGEDQRRELHWFKFKNDYERRLLFSTVAMVLDEPEISYRKALRGREVGFELTRFELADMVLHFEVYKREIGKHMERAFIAFVCANDIGSRKSSGAGEKKPMDPAELALLRQLVAGTRKVAVRKAIASEGAKP